jgi:hypothetical protein
MQTNNISITVVLLLINAPSTGLINILRRFICYDRRDFFKPYCLQNSICFSLSSQCLHLRQKSITVQRYSDTGNVLVNRRKFEIKTKPRRAAKIKRQFNRQSRRKENQFRITVALRTLTIIQLREKITGNSASVSLSVQLEQEAKFRLHAVALQA